MKITNAQLERWAAGDFAEFNYRTSEVMTLIQTLAGRVLAGERHGSLAGLDKDDCPQYEWRSPPWVLPEQTFEDYVQGAFPNPEDEYGVPEIAKALPALCDRLGMGGARAKSIMRFCDHSSRMIRSVDIEKRLITGYAVIWGESCGNWVTEKEAISEGRIADFLKNPIFVFNYNYSLVIGKVLRLESDRVGLSCQIQFCDEDRFVTLLEAVEINPHRWPKLGISAVAEKSESVSNTTERVLDLALEAISLEFFP